VFERLVVWSAAAGVLWLAGAPLESDQRLVLWFFAIAHPSARSDARAPGVGLGPVFGPISIATRILDGIMTERYAVDP
jgi:hypothetical protein